MSSLVTLDLQGYGLSMQVVEMPKTDGTLPYLAVATLRVPSPSYPGLWGLAMPRDAGAWGQESGEFLPSRFPPLLRRCGDADWEFEYPERSAPSASWRHFISDVCRGSTSDGRWSWPYLLV